MTELEELTKERARIADRIWELNRRDNRLRNVEAIGKCYRYKNSYGGNGSWWLYIKVTGIDDEGNLLTLNFQTDAFGGIEIKPRCSAWSITGGKHEEISSDDFDAAWAAVRLDVLSISA